jgi:hypothetical protein
MEVIKEEITAMLRANSKARTKLCYVFDVHMNTINRALDQNDKGLYTRLTTPAGLKAISEELGVKKSELLTDAQ